MRSEPNTDRPDGWAYGGLRLPRISRGSATSGSPAPPPGFGTEAAGGMDRATVPSHPAAVPAGRRPRDDEVRVIALPLLFGGGGPETGWGARPLAAATDVGEAQHQPVRVAPRDTAPFPGTPRRRRIRRQRDDWMRRQLRGVAPAWPTTTLAEEDVAFQDAASSWPTVLRHRSARWNAIDQRPRIGG